MSSNNNSQNDDKWFSLNFFLCFIGFLLLVFLFINEIYERVNFTNLFVKIAAFIIAYRMLASSNMIVIFLGLLMVFGAYNYS